MARAPVLLAVAIALEVTGTLALRLADGFADPGWAAVVVLAYASSVVVFARALDQGLGLGVAYGTLTGVGLRRRGWAATTFVMLVASMWCVSTALTLGLSVAVAYGIWTGAGVALAALTGHVVFGDRLNRPQTVGLVLILLGVVLLQTP